MNGLRMFTGNESSGTVAEENVFYSRRGNGPFYRWSYEQALEDWHVARIVTTDFNSHSLAAAAWKVVPLSLQAKLSQHYLD